MLHIESQGFFLLPCLCGGNSCAREFRTEVFGSDVVGGLGRIRPFHQLAHPQGKLFLIRDCGSNADTQPPLPDTCAQ